MATFTMRSHQAEMDLIARQIKGGIFPKQVITLDCTPGGGKTGAATILINQLLDAGIIDSVLWLVPRLMLADQILDSFVQGIGSRPGHILETAEHPGDLFQPSILDVVGRVTTYQSVAACKENAELYQKAVQSHRTLLILDEVQFLNAEDLQLEKGWTSRVAAVQAYAAYTLVMTGTIWRTDKCRLPFIHYERDPNDFKWYPKADISYDLRKAIAERAVIPIEWNQKNATVEYEFNGQRQIHELGDECTDQESHKIRTFLETPDCVHGVIDEMITHWRDWCRNVYKSRMIVMANDIASATSLFDHIKSHYGINCILTTSDDKSARFKLKKFRDGDKGQCLVTVAMAYVGFDCPDLTHMAYLNSTRAWSWLGQAFSRINRFDSEARVPYEQQHGFVFGPDDPPLRQYLDWLRTQQKLGIADRRGGPSRAATGEGSPPDNFQAIAATLGDTSVESLQGRIPPQDVLAIKKLVSESPPYANNLTISQWHNILVRMNHPLPSLTNKE